MTAVRFAELRPYIKPTLTGSDHPRRTKELTLQAGLMEERGDRSIRILGGELFVAIFAEGALGVLLTSTTGTEETTRFFLHVGLGLGVAGFAGWTLWVAYQQPNQNAKVAAALAFFGIVATGTYASLDLRFDFPSGTLPDQVLALVSLFGAALMVILGSPHAPVRPSAVTSPPGG